MDGGVKIGSLHFISGSARRLKHEEISSRAFYSIEFQGKTGYDAVIRGMSSMLTGMIMQVREEGFFDYLLSLSPGHRTLLSDAGKVSPHFQ